MRIGHEVSSGMYYEILGREGAETPILFIHGGGLTGACFRGDLHGNRGGPICWPSVGARSG